MGCDIHLHIEVMIDDKWEHYSSPKIERNYKLFGLMAGVRDNTIKPICPPKGLSGINDMTIITSLDRGRMFHDYHHLSWFDKYEIKEFSKIISLCFIKDNGFPMDLEMDILHTYLFGSSFCCLEHVQDVRFIFWFDN